MRNGAFRLVLKRSKEAFLLNTGGSLLLNSGDPMELNNISNATPIYESIPYFLLNTGAPLKLNSGKEMTISEN